MKKTQKSSKTAPELPQTCRKNAADLPQLCYKSVPLLQKFRGYLRRDVAKLPQIWIPIETNLLIRYEFATLPAQTRYIFVAILLYCGARGIDEIPTDIRFLANALAVDERMLKKSLEELEISGLLLERKKEREIRKDTDRQTETPAARVSVNSENPSETRIEAREKDADKNETDKKDAPDSVSNENSRHSQFSIEECLKYVEAEIKSGAAIQNPKALASNLYKSGEADSFIRAALYPERQKEVDRQIYGEPRRFSLDPCAVCFGAKMANIEGKGFAACPHCKNEKGKSTGCEPEGENDETV